MILAMDPGLKTYSYAVVNGSTIITTGYLDSLEIGGKIDFGVGLERFYTRVLRLVSDTGVTELVIERMLNQGHIKIKNRGIPVSPSIEPINIMIGRLCALRDLGITISLVRNVDWKSQRSKLPRVLAQILEEKLKPIPNEHQRDAASIAFYHQGWHTLVPSPTTPRVTPRVTPSVRKPKMPKAPKI